MKKHLVSLLLTVGLTLPALAQVTNLYVLSTNLCVTNFLPALSTNIYTGNQYLAMTRNSQMGLYAGAWGSGHSSNAFRYTFKGSDNTTNWTSAAIFEFGVPARGTNEAIGGTNWDVGAWGYIMPYEVINTCTNDLTNAFLRATLKNYRKDYQN